MGSGVYSEILKNIVKPDDIRLCSQVNKTFRSILKNKLKLSRCLYQLKQKYKYNPFLLIFKNHIPWITNGNGFIPWDFYWVRTNQLKQFKKNNEPDYIFGLERCSLIFRRGIKYQLKKRCSRENDKNLRINM